MNTVSRWLGLAAATVLALGADAALRAQSVAQGFDGAFWPEGAPVAACGSFAAGDVNEDGLPDLVTSNLASGDIVTYLATGGGSFGFGLVTHLLDEQIYAATMRLADVDVDGHLDILAGHSAWLGHGDGFFGQALVSEGSGTSTVVLDVDGDGLPDLARTSAPPGAQASVLWQRGLGDGHFEAPIVIQTARSPRWIAAGDLDGDGLTDLVYVDSDEPSGAPVFAVVLRHLGGGSFADPVAYPAGTLLPGPLAIADLDADGHPDVLKVDAGAVLELRGAGDGTLLPAVTLPIAGAGLHSLTSGLHAVDMDRDGRLDLVVSDIGPTLAAGEHVLVQRMGRSAPIGAPAVVGVGGALSRLAVADFDADGLPDIAAAQSQVRVNLSALGPFIDIGYGQTSPAGTPVLSFSGAPSAGQHVSFAVTGLPQLSGGLIVFGLEPAYTSFQGGLLVPAPLASFLTVTGVGFGVGWPAGIPAGTAVYAQAVMTSIAGLQQPVLSNAVVIVAE
jgi:hypothetical protein